MAQTKVQLVSNIVGNVSGGASFTGIVTAPGGIQGIGIQSAGNNVTTGVITALNFVGSGNTFVYNSSTKTVDISISGGSGGGGIGTAINYGNGTASPFSYIDSQVTITSDLNLNTGSDSYVVSVIPNVTIASGVAVTVGSGKTMLIDVLNIGDL